jgi:uncharacterized integral membrane protein (TIGR00697 family)
MVLFILPSIFFKKTISLPMIGIIPVSILLTGTYFSLLDIVAEVYGYYEAKKVLFSGLLGYVIFTVIVEVSINLPVPQDTVVKWSSVQDVSAYVFIFKDLYLFCLGALVAGLIGSTLNVIVLSKWKIIAHGKYFWLRSIFSSSIAAMIYSSVSMIIAISAFANKMTSLEITKFILISFVAKMITITVLCFPATILCFILKRIEKIDVYDNNVKYDFF